MLGQISSKVVFAVKLRACTEEEIVVLRVIQYSIDSCHRRDANWRRWQALVDVGIEWRLILQMLIQDASEFEISNRIFYGRARSKRNTSTKTIDVNTCNQEHFRRNLKACQVCGMV